MLDIIYFIPYSPNNYRSQDCDLYESSFSINGENLKNRFRFTNIFKNIKGIGKY